jgi:histidine triad (HIT) family protein
MAAECRFCDIVGGRLPAHSVMDGPGILAFLDSRPVFPGHVLVVPTEHYETMLQLPDEAVGPLFVAVRRLAAAVVAALGADGTFVAANNTVSQSVPHLHVHVVPRRFKDGLRGFFWPRQRYADENEQARVANLIRAALTDN